eukprot:273456-Amphidinium_carterae.2
MSPLLSTFVGSLWLRQSESLALVAPKLRNQPEAWPRASLPAPAEDAEAPQVLPVEPRPQAPRVDCNTQTGKRQDAVEDEVPGQHPEVEPQGMHAEVEPQGIG